MKAEDLTGKRFGKLTAIELGEHIIADNGRRYTTWRCRCDCGRERTVRTTYLKQGYATYCGQCEPPAWLGAKHRKCRYCEFSIWNAERLDWDCSKGKDTFVVKKQCDDFWCAPVDKLYRIKNKSGRCLICGRPVYTHGQDIPIYCYEHRAQADSDQKIIQEAPKELLFSLITAIFRQARTDYLTNADGQRSDAEVFLRGEWAQDLSLDGYDVERLFQILDEETDDGRSDIGEDS